MFKNYFRIAWRVITRNRLYTLISVASLALGICGCIVIWLVAHYEFGFDRFHPGGDRIYRVGSIGQPGVEKSAEVLPPMPDVFRRTIPGLENVTTFFPLYQSNQVRIPATAGKPAAAFDTRMKGENGMPSVVITDADWFKVFQYHWLVGNPVSAMKQPFAVVLTEGRARLYFGALRPEAFIGKELVYQDSLHLYVAGIVKDWKANSDVAYTDFISFATIAASFLKDVRHMDDWQTHHGGGQWFWPGCFVRLARGVRPERVDAAMQAIGKRAIIEDSTHPFQLQLQPLTDIHFDNAYSNDNLRKAHLPTLYALMGIAVFILILGVVNFVNLSTAQSIHRAKEIGVRKVLGSGRASLVAQFFTETGVIATLAVFLAVLLVRPVMNYFREYIPAGVHFRLADPANLLFLLGILTVTTLLAGFYPAKVLAAYLPVISLKGGGTQKGGEKWWLRKSLIVFQFTISLVFIIASLLIGNQIRWMLKTDYGFRTNAIVMARVAEFWDTTGRAEILEQKFRQLPGIAEVVREGVPPIGWGRIAMEVDYKGREVMQQNPIVEFGDHRFIPFYAMRLVAGRNIRETDSLAEWVINETSARAFGFKRPAEAIGHMLYFGDRGYPVVGVVADFHEGSFKEVIQPLVIGHMPQLETMLGIRLASAGRSPEKVKETLGAMEKIFIALYPKDAFSYSFLDDSIAQLYETEQKTAALVRAVMILAIFISCMGLFGLALFTARRKAAEISIRKVLGATAGDIAALLNKGFVGLVLLSLVIASPVAWWLTDRWLRDFAYRTPIAWWVFPLAGAGAVVIALVTVSFQSIRAAMANPVKHLHNE
jgi:putative ABC transport system permease protein